MSSHSLFFLPSSAMTVELQLNQLIDLVNDQWKVNAIESGYNNYYQVEIGSVGRKYIKVTSKMNTDPKERKGSAYAFVDKVTGEVYKAASWSAPAKGVRGTVAELLTDTSRCDPYGGWLYLR